MKTKELIEKNINAMELYEYLTAPSNHWAGLYPDGSFHVGESVGSEIDEEERPLITIKCPGLNEMDDPSYWTDEWTEFDEDTGLYHIIEVTKGHNIGDSISLNECIRVCCEHYDVSDQVNYLRDSFKREILWRRDD